MTLIKRWLYLVCIFWSQRKGGLETSYWWSAANLKGTVDRFIVDPPFLSEDCQTKGTVPFPSHIDERQVLIVLAAMSVRWLSKAWGTGPSNESRVIVCTGERMEGLITKLYRPQGVATTSFEPVHAKGLSNEFFCYANFEGAEWKWKAKESWFWGLGMKWSMIAINIYISVSFLANFWLW